MKVKLLIIGLVLLSNATFAQYDESFATEEYTGMMNGWTMHYAYTNTQEIAYVGGLIYGLADGSLFSYDPKDEEIRCLNALNGLSGSGIGHIIADNHQRLLVAYRDGTFDVIEADGTIHTITDLKQKQLSGVSKLANDMFFYNHDAYLACDFGVLVVNVRKNEIAEWYQPVEEGHPMLKQLQIIGDSIFAQSETTFYAAKLTQNLVDFANWQQCPLEERSMDSIPVHFSAYEQVDGCNYHAWGEKGMIRDCDGVKTTIRPNGPAVNSPYRMTFAGEKMVMVPGARWTSESATMAEVMILEEGEWQHIPYASLPTPREFNYVFDFTRAAIDPQDKQHFFISSYGEGLYEFRGKEVVNLYNIYNSPLISAAHPQTNYCRVDGVAFDPEGYLWMLNATNQKAVHILSPNGEWAAISLRQPIETPGDVLIDQKRPNYRWVVSCRQPAGIGLIDDGGTPMNTADDKVMFRTTWVDNRGYTITPSEIRSIAQDRNGAIWIGTNEGLLMIPTSVDFFSSNRCTRILIARTDGSGLGDFMLGTEQINSIAVDGGNRLWIGTAVSGVFLMDIDLFGDETKTVKHFTTKNAPLPSNTILNVAVDPLQNEVYIGTDMGLVSYKSDASEPEEDFTSAYVYPNPVRPGYSGLLTITGLMENSIVKIADSGGNLVFTGHAAGGTAVWDMCGYDGRKVSPGVYMIFCNSASGYEPEGHKALKVLIM